MTSSPLPPPPSITRSSPNPEGLTKLTNRFLSYIHTLTYTPSHTHTHILTLNFTLPILLYFTSRIVFSNKIQIFFGTYKSDDISDRIEANFVLVTTWLILAAVTYNYLQ